MKCIKILLGIFTFLVTLNCNADEEHHNLKVNNCRAQPSGYIQILGISESDNLERNLTFSTDMFSEKVLDRYFSLCMASIASGLNLRIDYLECTENSCTPKSNTTAQLYKS